jgi:hypothetical protein
VGECGNCEMRPAECILEGARTGNSQSLKSPDFVACIQCLAPEMALQKTAPTKERERPQSSRSRAFFVLRQPFLSPQPPWSGTSGSGASSGENRSALTVAKSPLHSIAEIVANNRRKLVLAPD